MPEMSINGAAPLLAAGDIEATLVIMRCACGNKVGVLRSVDSRARTGRQPLLYAEVQLVVDWSANPVATERARFEIPARKTDFPTDCPQCGRILIDCDSARREAIAAWQHMDGPSVARTWNLTPSGRKVEPTPPDGMSIDEVSELLNWPPEKLRAAFRHAEEG